MDLAALRADCQGRPEIPMVIATAKLVALLDVAEATEDYLAWETGDGGDDEGERLYWRVKSTLNALAKA